LDKFLALPKQQAQQDDSNDTSQTTIKFQLGFSLLLIKISKALSQGKEKQT